MECAPRVSDPQPDAAGVILYKVQGAGNAFVLRRYNAFAKLHAALIKSSAAAPASSGASLPALPRKELKLPWWLGGSASSQQVLADRVVAFQALLDAVWASNLQTSADVVAFLASPSVVRAATASVFPCQLRVMSLRVTHRLLWGVTGVKRF